MAVCQVPPVAPSSDLGAGNVMSEALQTSLVETDQIEGQNAPVPVPEATPPSTVTSSERWTAPIRL